MVHVIGDLGLSAASVENISGTSLTGVPDSSAAVNSPGQSAGLRASGGCPFVIADWRAGEEPFCGAPTRPGSSYCSRHQPLCVVPRESAEARLREDELLAEADA